MAIYPSLFMMLRLGITLLVCVIFCNVLSEAWGNVPTDSRVRSAWDRLHPSTQTEQCPLTSTNSKHSRHNYSTEIGKV